MIITLKGGSRHGEIAYAAEDVCAIQLIEKRESWKPDYADLAGMAGPDPTFKIEIYDIVRRETPRGIWFYVGVYKP